MADVVHILHAGHALCGKPGVPGDWGPGHKWVARDTDALGDRSETNCPGCLAGYQIWKIDPDRLPEYIAEQRAAHREVDPSELGELLTAVLAWRAQGAVSRWTTGPSVHLARLADRLVREHPVSLRAMRDRARDTAIANALQAAERLQTASGRAREMGETFAELTSVVERFSSLADATLTAAAEPPPERPLARTRELLRRFAAEWRATEGEPSTREYVGPRFDLLREVLDAFEEEDLRE